MKKYKSIMLSIFFTVFLSACQKSEGVEKNSFPVKTATVTMEDWKKAFTKTYKVSAESDKGDGVTEFMAEFPTLSFGKRDAFNKIYTFKPAITQLEWDVGPSVRTFVGILDGKHPMLIVSPYYWGRDGWIFMNKLSIMVNGEIIFERKFDGNKVKRTSNSGFVEEEYNIAVNDEEISALRKISKNSDVKIRIAGDRNYINIKNDKIDFVESFKTSIAESLQIYDSIEKGIKENIVPDAK
jgi:hypothetical protein